METEAARTRAPEPLPAPPAPVPLVVAGAQGLAWGALPDAVERALPGWVASGGVPEGEVLKAGRVFRVGSHVVKFTRASGPRDRWRDAAALRSARLHARLLPIASPRPVAALQWRSAGMLHGLLVNRFVDGRFIETLWRDDARAMERFAAFLAAMHARRVFHGDFHYHNMIWDGARWWLLDLEGLRHPLRCLRPRRLILDQWARLHFCLARAPELEPHLARYLALAGHGWDPGRTWEEVAERSAHLVQRWGPPPPQPQRTPPARGPSAG